jgi:hypothetical protein
MSSVPPFFIVISKGSAEVLVSLVREARSMLVAEVKFIFLAVASSVKSVNEVNAPKSIEVIFVS